MSKKKPKVRAAKIQDKGLFRKLWKEFLEHEVSQGGNILPTDKNLDVYCNIFEKYVNGELPGVVSFIAEDAVLMWGSSGAPVFDTNIDPIAQGWGTYVRERARGKGYSRRIREVSLKRLESLKWNDGEEEKKFKHLYGSAQANNEAGIESARSLGYDFPAVIGILKLNKDKEE